MRVIGCWRTFNSEKWLGYSILSALAWIDEALVVDGDFGGGASTDRTLAIADRFGDRVPLHVHHNGPCLGWAGKNNVCLELARAIPDATHIFLVDHDEIPNLPNPDTLRLLAQGDATALGLRRREFVARLDRLVVDPVPHKLSVLRLDDGIECQTLDARGYNEHWVDAEGRSLLEVGTAFVSDPSVWLDHLRNVEGHGRLYRDLWYRFVEFEDPQWADAQHSPDVARQLRAHILAHDVFTGGLSLRSGHIAPAAFRCKTRRPWQRRRLDVCSGAVEAPRSDTVAMDVRPFKGVDVVHDAADLPWPFSDGEFDCVTLHHGLEHIHWDHVQPALEEAFRVLGEHGSIHIIGPDACKSLERAVEGSTPAQEAMRRVLGIVDEDYERHQSLLMEQWLIDCLGAAGFSHASVLAEPSDWEIEVVGFRSTDLPVPAENDPAPPRC